MKKTILLINLLLLTLFIPLSSWAAPKIQIPQDTYNFDAVPEGTVIKHNFLIKNNGDETLIIERVITG